MPRVMTPRQRVLAAWRGDLPDRIPFAIWHTRLFAPDYEPLLKLDACIIVRSHVYEMEYEGIQVEAKKYTDERGVEHTRTIYHTRAGDLSTLTRFGHATRWTEERLFRHADDYDALIELVRAARFNPTYERFAKDDAKYGGQGLARPAPLRSPMYEIIHDLMGVETFSLERADNPDAIDELYDALLEQRRRALEVIAKSPARIAIVEGNIAFEIVGPERFKKYYFPAIEEACELCRANGIMTGAHLDGNNAQLAPHIAETSLTCIEAHTPPPDCDLDIAGARRAWPDKGIHLNFPSSVHLSGEEAVVARAREMLDDMGDGTGFCMGLTEDISTNDYLPAIARVVRENGKTPLRGNRHE